MANEKFINRQQIYDFFKLLNDNHIEYVLIKNIDGELPYHLKDGKDIDILVNINDRQKFTRVMFEGGFLKRIHPLGKEAGWKFGYQLPEYQFWQKNGIEETFYIDCCFKLMCKSLTPKYWVPLDEMINSSVWKNKMWDDELECWKIDKKTLLPYLLARCVFDKKIFSEVYKKELKNLIEYLDDEAVQKMLNTIFYKFTPSLIELIKAEKYDDVVTKYISFSNY